MSKLVVLDHPLMFHKVTRIRDKKTNTKEFKELVREISCLLTYEMARDFKIKSKVVETPLCRTEGYELDQPIIVIPILRAGLGMVEGITDLIPTAVVGHIGLYRNEETLQPEEYYAKFPKGMEYAEIIVLDPMLATGGSASKAISLVKKNGGKHIRYLGIVGTPQGVKRLQEDHPDVNIFLAAVDAELDEHGYIVPGLGDCGDRLFGTKPEE